MKKIWGQTMDLKMESQSIKIYVFHGLSFRPLLQNYIGTIKLQWPRKEYVHFIFNALESELEHILSHLLCMYSPINFPHFVDNISNSEPTKSSRSKILPK